MQNDYYIQDGYLNLADPRLGAKVVNVTDEWFGKKENLLKLAAPIFLPDKYDDHGKWMDGWETRRRRGLGHDHCVVRLGCPGRLREAEIDTTHFTGNYPLAASLDGCHCDDDVPSETTKWMEILPPIRLQGDSQNIQQVNDDRSFSHVRLNIYPDGGIARLRLRGEPERDWSQHDDTTMLDLFAADNGGRAIACSDQHYGSVSNINMPGRGENMGDGWETRRRRVPGNDWAVLALGHAGVIHAVEIDTAHFKGNYPHQCSIQAAYAPGTDNKLLVTNSMFWQELLPPQKMQMDSVLRFETEIRDIGAVTHARFNMIPDGGVSRVRLHGNIVK